VGSSLVEAQIIELALLSLLRERHHAKYRPSSSKSAASPDKFHPQWPEEARDDCLSVPGTNGRTPHPNFIPEDIIELISNTYLLTKELVGRLSEFTLFPKLPLEMRLMIWKHSLPGPRLMEVFYEDTTGVCKSTCSLPIPLHANREARDVALESYELCFGTKKAPPMIYFNTDIDQLYVGIGNSSPPSEMPQIGFFNALQVTDRSRI
jgi:2EXR family